ncbi:hypothetical protein SAMN05216215_105239 [Saccharopolyspora shandongensis]|uniref:Uncharacterized protein n=1 Tax=Saccharopolyspora shandongensis TaxID=418495 RepID=A0A1H3R7W3_9PSEU|nr:hypothetical protein SAMN05216215_105239 [Saccharopolyspora shandongensis]
MTASMATAGTSHDHAADRVAQVVRAAIQAVQPR